MRGAYVLQDYAISFWLEHIIKGSLDGRMGHSLEQISHDLEELVELRTNLSFEQSRLHRVAIPCHNILRDTIPEMFETVVSLYSFYQIRWRERSLADGRLFRFLVALRVLT